jgi:NAD(P)-dependent dehydrogenase (short-subunit alcohol dehydrogenase family)
MKRLERNRILVTGAASGIGQATALRLLDEGASVVAADVAADGLDKTRAMAQEAGGGERLTTLEMNIADEKSVIDGVRSAVNTLGGLDSVVNAAGILRAAHTDQMDLQAWNQIIGINLTGTFLVVRETLPTLLQNPRSAIVNFSSRIRTWRPTRQVRAGFSPSLTHWHWSTRVKDCARCAWRPEVSSPESPMPQPDTSLKTRTGHFSPA